MFHLESPPLLHTIYIAANRFDGLTINTVPEDGFCAA